MDISKFPETADIETSSDDYARRFEGRVGEWFLQIQENATLDMLIPHPGASVLDVGGGHGQLTDGLVRSGYKVTVLGSSEECRNRIISYVNSGKVAFNTGNILNMPYQDKSFDVVISYRLLAHVDRWHEFLAELMRVSRHAVIIDYPEVRSINYIAPYMFRFKKNIEKNTRKFASFREKDLLKIFNDLDFYKEDRFPEFLLPMVLHRKLKQCWLSSAIERCLRFVGLTNLLGSPVIMKVVRK
ncbi:MAG: class I SAM-dependent methyltransferase [Armatimonadota bacterium]